MTATTRQLTCNVALAAAMGLAASQANAYFLYPNDVTEFEDNDIELLVNADPADTDSILDVGDSLRGVLSIDALFSGSGTQPVQGLMGGSSANLGDEEITGIFEIEVVQKVQDPGSGLFTFVFGPKASFGAVYGANAALALFNETVGDLVIITDPASCDKTSVAECEARATDSDSGTPDFVFGFSDADAQWAATGLTTDDLSVIAGLGAGASAGDYNFALGLESSNKGPLLPRQLLCGPTAFACLGDGEAELIGSGSVVGGLGLQSGYDARSDFQFGIEAAAVPAPGSIALIGLGLTGLATLRRRKRTAA